MNVIKRKTTFIENPSFVYKISFLIFLQFFPRSPYRIDKNMTVSTKSDIIYALNPTSKNAKNMFFISLDNKKHDLIAKDT